MPTLHQTMNKLTYRGPSPILVRLKQIGMVADHNYTEEGVQKQCKFSSDKGLTYSNCEAKIVIRRRNALFFGSRDGANARSLADASFKKPSRS
jgi:hypothetical protein